MGQLSAADRALLTEAQERARARMGRTIDETGKDVARLSNLLTIRNPVATMGDNGGRQDANTQQGQDGRAAAALPPSDTIGSRDFYSCGGITEAVMGKAFKIEVVSKAADLHYWRIKAGNGEIICHSETYTTRSAAMQTLDSFAAWIGGLVAASVQFVDAEVPES